MCDEFNTVFDDCVLCDGCVRREKVVCVACVMLVL